MNNITYLTEPELHCIRLEAYVDKIVDGIFKQFPVSANEVGFNRDVIENMICSVDEYDLITRNVYYLWENDISVNKAIEYLSVPIHTYFNSTMEAM